MIAIFSLLLILALSILVTRIATVALGHTGLSRELARFQSRSAFTGVGFTTSEAENVVSHPVRRRIIMLLMILGNVGIISSISTLILSFIDTKAGLLGWPLQLAILGIGVALLWALASSRWVDRWLSRLISWALENWTSITILDYPGLLHLSGGYKVKEVKVGSEDWLANKSLADLSLPEEGVTVLGIERSDGTYVGTPTGDTKVEVGDTLITYGRSSVIQALDEREAGVKGDEAHDESVEEQQKVLEDQARREKRRFQQQ